MTDNIVTSFEDARAMKAMGLPLDTPIIKRKFSCKGTKLWAEAYKLLNKFVAMTKRQDDTGFAGTVKQAVNLHKKLIKARANLETYIVELNASRDEVLQGEAIAHRVFIEQALAPFIDVLQQSIEETCNYYN